MDNNLHVIYAYYEKNDMYRLNLIYFLTYGYRTDIDYTIVINDKCSVNIPQKENITVIHRENVGYDFQGYFTGIMSLKNKGMLREGDHYMFLNCTVCGPFLPSYTKNYVSWYQPYLDLLSDNVKLVGSTINLNPHPHVQSYLFIMGYQCIQFLLDKEFFKIYKTRDEVILHQEIAMSQVVLKNGWNISCLIPEYQRIDYTQFNIVLKKGAQPKRILSPYEVIFVKSLWSDPSNQFIPLLQLNLPLMEVQKNNCYKAIYGKSIRKSVDVTKILKKFETINVCNMSPNTLFGDPHLGHRKSMWIFLEDLDEPIILQEYCGQFCCDNKKYSFYRDHKNLQLLLYRDMPVIIS